MSGASEDGEKWFIWESPGFIWSSGFCTRVHTDCCAHTYLVLSSGVPVIPSREKWRQVSPWHGTEMPFNESLGTFHFYTRIGREARSLGIFRWNCRMVGRTGREWAGFASLRPFWVLSAATGISFPRLSQPRKSRYKIFVATAIGLVSN